MAADIVLNRSDRVYELSISGNARENPLSSFRRPVRRGITLHRHREQQISHPLYTHELTQIIIVYPYINAHNYCINTYIYIHPPLS